MTDVRPNLVGINHVALEVGDIEEALAFYGRYFRFDLRGRGDHAVFIDIGDQFLALMQSDRAGADGIRHFGLVVDDRDGLRARMEADGVTFVSDQRFDFLDPWGNRVEIVEYADIQFVKAREVLNNMGRTDLHKSPRALSELRDKGIAPEDDW
ncbi:MAG: VOC family protein [Rhodobacteraceae bacterium]|nr:VOC family protein [Paracoccaceae bacterium]